MSLPMYFLNLKRANLLQKNMNKSIKTFCFLRERILQIGFDATVFHSAEVHEMG
jgi:hypothetical protein